MIIGSRRIILIGVIAAVALTIIFLPLIFSWTATGLENVSVELKEVEVRSVEPQDIKLRVVFELTNPTSQTVTTSKIEYELFVDGVSLGLQTLSYEDIPVTGRPALFPGGTVSLPSDINLPYSDSYAGIFDKISNDSENIEWDVAGTAQIESALTLRVNSFDTRNS